MRQRVIAHCGQTARQSLDEEYNLHIWEKIYLMESGITGDFVLALIFEGKCSYLRAKPAHMVGHLPTTAQSSEYKP